MKMLNSAMAAKILGFTPDYVRRLMRTGKIKAQKLGSDWIITEKSLKNINRQRKRKNNL